MLVLCFLTKKALSGTTQKSTFHVYVCMFHVGVGTGFYGFVCQTKVFAYNLLEEF